MTRQNKGSDKRVMADTNAHIKTTTKVARNVSADGLENCISGMGTAIDKRTYTKYSYVRPFAMQELDAMYRQSWLCKRIVNIVPDDITRKWREFNLDSPRKIKKIQDYEKQLKTRHKFIQAMRWARLYGGSIIVMITDDMDFNDPETCSTPLDLNSIKKDSLKSLMVYDRWRVYPDYELVSDIESPDFEMPAYYRITSNPQVNINAPRIHYSRILRFDGELLPYMAFIGNARWHDSVLQHVYDSIINNESAKQSVSAMMDEATIDCYKYVGLKDTLENTADGEKLVSERIRVTNLSKSIFRARILDAEDSYEKISPSFANLDKILHSCDKDVSGAAKIPYSKLFEQEIGGLNSSGESDENKYYDDLASSQENDLRPQLEKFDQVLIRSVLGQYPDNYSFEFPSLWQESDVDKATLQYNNAQRDAIYLTNRVLSAQDIADKLLSDKIYNNITVPEQIELDQTNNDPAVTNKNNNKKNTANNKNDKSK